MLRSAKDSPATSWISIEHSKLETANPKESAVIMCPFAVLFHLAGAPGFLELRCRVRGLKLSSVSSGGLGFRHFQREGGPFLILLVALLKGTFL